VAVGTVEAALFFEARYPITSETHRRRYPNLPRSRHLPLASTEGSLIENLNKTAVRLWT
jgi:hypothetical protein